MAAIQTAAGMRHSPVAPPGMDVTDRGYATEAIKAGDLIVIAATAPLSPVYEFSVSKATAGEAHGIALIDCGAKGLVEFSTQNEIEGYTGLTPGAALYVVNGKLDTAAPVDGVVVGRCVTTTRIRVLMV